MEEGKRTRTAKETKLEILLDWNNSVMHDPNCDYEEIAEGLDIDPSGVTKGEVLRAIMEEIDKLQKTHKDVDYPK